MYLATLDADSEVEEAWAAEVERRQYEIENGTVSLLPGPETLARLKAEFKSLVGEFEQSINNLLLHPALGSPWM